MFTSQERHKIHSRRLAMQMGKISVILPWWWEFKIHLALIFVIVVIVALALYVGRIFCIFVVVLY